MAGANRAVKTAAARLAKLRKEQARVVKKAHDLVARAERLTESVGAAEQALREALAVVARRAGARAAAVPAAAPAAAPTPRARATATPAADARRTPARRVATTGPTRAGVRPAGPGPRRRG